MNQKNIFSERASLASFLKMKHAPVPRTSIFVLAGLAVCCVANFSFAQTQFASSTQTASSDAAQWTPPQVATPNFGQPPGGEAAGFPQSPVIVDPNVQPTSFEPSSAGGALPTPPSPDAATSTLSSISSTASEKISGFFKSLREPGGIMETFRTTAGSIDLGRMLGSLALVLGLYFAFVWITRKFNPVSNTALPPEVVEVMGMAPFGPRGNLQLVRLGSKLLLLINGPEGTQPIGEITDPHEVEYLTALCPGRKKVNRQRIAAPPPAPAPVTTAPVQTNQSNLAQVLRTLENATQQTGTIFEA